MNRKFIVLASVAAMSVALILYFGVKRGTDNGGGPTTNRTIVVVLPSSTNPYWLDVRRGAEEARADVPDFGVEIKVSTGDQDAKAQSYILSDLAARSDVAAVVLGPASASEPVAPLAALDRKGVPSVVIDTTLNKEKCDEQKFMPKAFVGSDNRGGAEKAAQAIFAELKRRGAGQPFRVLVLEGNRVHQSAIDRADGFYSQAKVLGIEVEGVRAEWNRAKAQDWTAQKFTVPGKFNAIFASNDDMALGAITGLKSINVNRARWPVIVGFDYTEPAIKAIEAGDMFGSVRQDPVAMGKEGVKLAAQAANKDPALPTAAKYLPIDVFPRPR